MWRWAARPWPAWTGRSCSWTAGLPGDRVQARVTKTNRRFADARLMTVAHPAATRVPARCVHVERCGGCRLQEMPYEQQATLKERQVREALRHLGGIADPPVRSIVRASEVWHYRNKMEFSFAPLPGPDGSEVAVLGLHERGTYDRIFELSSAGCPRRSRCRWCASRRRSRVSTAGARTTRRGTTGWRGSSPCATCRTPRAAPCTCWPLRRTCTASASGRAAWRRSRARCARSRWASIAAARTWPSPRRSARSWATA
jgi:hypothetical protein